VSIDRDDADERIARIDMLIAELRRNTDDLTQIKMVAGGRECIESRKAIAFARAVLVRDKSTDRTTRVSLWCRRRRKDALEGR